MEKFLEMKMRFPIGTAGYSCASFSASYAAGAETIYAIAFWPNQEQKGSQLQFGADAESKVGDPEYLCVSPTFDSRDGEYRRRLLPYKTFCAIVEQHAELLAPFEAAVSTMSSGGALNLKLKLKTECFGNLATAKCLPGLKESRLPLVALAVALMLDTGAAVQGLLALHTHKNYSDFITSCLQDSAAGDSLTVPIPERVLIDFTAGVGANRLSVQCGVKLVPMFARETQLPFDYNLGAWRELEITKLVGDITLAYISPSFAIYNQWSYIEEVSARLFENRAMHDRYERGLVAEKAATDLRAGRAQIDGAPAALHNYYSEELSSHIYESLEYAQSHLMMSSVALLHSIEHVGLTLAGWPAFIRRSAVVRPSQRQLFADEASFARLLFEYAYGARCLHEHLGVVHGDLHSNNLTVYGWGRAEAKRTDPDTEYRMLYTDPAVIFLAGPRGEADSYLFPAAGISGCLIDYSRAIIGPAFRPRLEAGRSAQYATNFYRDQVNRVMRLLHRHAPEYVLKHQDAIKGAAYADFGAVFAALCAVDFIAVGMSAAAVIEQAVLPDSEEMRRFECAPGALALARRLEAAGREALISALHVIVTARIGGAPCLFDCAHAGGDSGRVPQGSDRVLQGSDRVLQGSDHAPQGSDRAPQGSDHAPCCCAQFASEYPAAAAAMRECAQADGVSPAVRAQAGAARAGGAQVAAGARILEQVFGDYLFARQPPARIRSMQLVDAYNFNNTIEGCSSTDFAHWPRWALPSEIEKHLGRLKMTDLFADGVEGFLGSITGRELPLELLAAQSHARAAQLDGAAASNASSWIDE
jgi:hypothetical protein